MQNMHKDIEGLQKVDKREIKRRKAAYKAQAEREVDSIYVASQFKLTVMRFKRNRLAVFGFVLPFLASSFAGACIAAVVTGALYKAGVLESIRRSLEGRKSL